MELRLVVEAHGGGDRVGQRRLLDERGGQPGLDRGLRLALGVRAAGARAEVGIGRAAPEVAVDPVLLDAVGHPRERGLVGGAVGPRAVGAEARAQAVVDHPVLGGDLGRRVAAHAAREPVGLEQHDAGAGLLQQQRRRDPDDAAADHGDLGVDALARAAAARAARVRCRPRPTCAWRSRRSCPAQRQLLQAHQRLGVAAARDQLQRREERERGEHAVGGLASSSRACRRLAAPARA